MNNYPNKLRNKRSAPHRRFALVVRALGLFNSMIGRLIALSPGLLSDAFFKKSTLPLQANFSWIKSLQTFVWVLAISLTVNTTTVQAKSYPKEEVRAAFLFNFLKFVEWPDSTFTDATSPFNICLFGDIGSKKIFNKLSKQEAKSRTIQVDYSGVDGTPDLSPEHLAGCHIVYLGFMQTDAAEQILQATENHAILTVSIIDHFIENGGMITLVTQGKKNILQINLNAAQSAGLKISANMLDVAQIVEP